MNSVQIEQKSYEMPPRDGFTVTHFITVADIDRSAGFYARVFGGRILSRGDSKGASGHIQIANTWLIVNVGGGPTPDKPSVTLSVPADPDQVSSFLNIRVADIRACYELWKSRGHPGAEGAYGGRRNERRSRPGSYRGRIRRGLSRCVVDGGWAGARQFSERRSADESAAIRPSMTGTSG